jgi:hypothetical protein
MSVRFVDRATESSLFSQGASNLATSLRNVDIRDVERTLGWFLTVILLALWFVLNWPPSVLLALIGVQLLVATSPRRT